MMTYDAFGWNEFLIGVSDESMLTWASPSIRRTSAIRPPWQALSCYPPPPARFILSPTPATRSLHTKLSIQIETIPLCSTLQLLTVLAMSECS